MKILSVLFFLLMCSKSFANLYLKTEYQEGQRPKVVTKQHIFLDKRYTINYTKRSYVLILKKVTSAEATIESETYEISKAGNKTMIGGSYGTYRLGKAFTLTDGPRGPRHFSLKIYLEKIVL